MFAAGLLVFALCGVRPTHRIVVSDCRGAAADTTPPRAMESDLEYRPLPLPQAPRRARFSTPRDPSRGGDWVTRDRSGTVLLADPVDGPRQLLPQSGPGGGSVPGFDPSAGSAPETTPDDSGRPARDFYPYPVTLKTCFAAESGSDTCYGDAVLLDGSHVMTPAHCIFAHGSGTDAGVWASTVFLNLDAANPESRWQEVSWVGLHLWSAWMNRADPEFDVGFITLDGTVTPSARIPASDAKKP